MNRGCAQRLSDPVAILHAAMTLQTHWLPDLHSVAHEAAAILRTPPPGADPFAPDVLVVGGRGVEQWLRRALVQRLDILTNVQLWSPSRFVNDLQRWAMPGAGGGASRLTLAILSAVSSDPTLLPTELQHLNAHVDSRHGEAGPLLLTWAARMARTYEQYSLYRPEWLSTWEAHGNSGASAADWQARLWRAVVAHSYPSANVLANTVEWLRDAANVERSRDAGVPKLPPRWTVLHQGRLSPTHLTLLNALSVHHDVHVLVHAVTEPLMRLGTESAVANIAHNEDTLRERIVSEQHAVANRLDRVRTDGVLLLHRMLREAAE